MSKFFELIMEGISIIEEGLTSDPVYIKKGKKIGEFHKQNPVRTGIAQTGAGGFGAMVGTAAYNKMMKGLPLSHFPRQSKILVATIGAGSGLGGYFGAKKGNKRLESIIKNSKKSTKGQYKKSVNKMSVREKLKMIKAGK